MTIRHLAALTAALVLILALVSGTAVSWISLHPAFLVVIALATLLLLGVLWWRQVLRPLLALKRGLARLEDGRDQVRLQARGARELREMAEHFNFLAERVEDRRREQLRFISHVVHDLRNPLHSITMASELLELKSPEDNGELVKAIFRQVANLDVLLSDLIDLSRIEAGELELRLADQDVLALVREAVDDCRKGNDLHHFRIEATEQSLLCRCDPRRVAHVLRNLLSNAVKYSPQGGAVTVRAKREGGRIEVAVADQGRGIAQDELDNVFKPFYRLKSPGTPIPGKGLGLSTSRRIAEAHGGELGAESRPGKGSTFRLSIPAEGPERAK